MERFKINHLQVRGYRALHDVSIPLGALNVLIGPNGVGKSSFLDALLLLSDTLGQRESLNRLISRRGGLGRLLTLGHSDSFAIQIETAPIGGVAKNQSGGPLTYSIEVGQQGLSYIVLSELLTQDRGQPKPFYFVRRQGAHFKIFDPATKNLAEPDPPIPADELALALLPRTLREAEWFRTALGALHDYEPTPVDRSSPLRVPQTLQPTSLVASPSGSDLYSVLYQMRMEAPSWYERILDVLKAAFPSFDRIDFPVVAGGQVTLAWYDRAYPGTPFFANELSSGTLRFLQLVTLLLSPRIPDLVLLDELENSLHPQLVKLVTELLLEASERTQLIVATQSSALVGWCKPEHVIIADKEDGLCRLTPATELDLDKWLADYRLDELWEMNELGGRP